MALTTFGTLTSFETLAANTQTIAQFGEDRAWDGIASALNAWNVMVREATQDLMVQTTSRLRRYGGQGQAKMQKMDEMGTPNAQKQKAGSPVGFPLDAYGEALQWNRLYVLNRRTNEFAAQVQALMTADMQNMLEQIKIALFMGVSRNFIDYRVDQVSDTVPIPIKPLLNADGSVIPPGPQGQQFNPYTHTHYLATAAWNNAWLQGLLETVVEHYSAGKAMIYINRSDEPNMEAMEDFKALTYIETLKATNQEYGIGVLDPIQLYNRHIGWFRGAAVWVKPWMIPSYVFCFMAGVPQPLCMRIRGETPDGGNPVEGAGDFTIQYEDETHPLRARAYEREFGIGVWNRTNGAIGYIGGNGQYYVQPNITATPPMIN